MDALEIDGHTLARFHKASETAAGVGQPYAASGDVGYGKEDDDVADKDELVDE